MTLTEVQELLNNLDAHFVVYANNKDPRASHLMIKVYHSKGDGTTVIAFDMDGLNGMLVPSDQKD